MLAKFTVHEKHIAVYAGKNNTGIIKANRPERLLKNSVLTPSFAAGVIEAKYVNHIPLNRLSEDFRRKDAVISRQVLAGWMVSLLQSKLLESQLIHCDETPFKVISNGRSSNSKDYMWVFHTCERYGSPPIYIYNYHEGKRDLEALSNFIGDYSGILMTDGYQVYHSLENASQDRINVAGCRAHLKRLYVNYLKSVGSKNTKGLIADEGNKRIAAIYHVDNMHKDKDKDDRFRNRQDSVKPLVDAYFAWTKDIDSQSTIDKSSAVGKAITYSINQEPYLRKFLDNAIIPLDNNDAERSIRSFCVGKHSWHVIGTKKGAYSSAILYSIAETAKANNLKTFEYFKYILEQLLEHIDDDPKSYLEDIMPWSEKLPEYCCKIKTDN